MFRERQFLKYYLKKLILGILVNHIGVFSIAQIARGENDY